MAAAYGTGRVLPTHKFVPHRRRLSAAAVALPCPCPCPCRQDPLLARSAARYLRLVTPALYFTALFEVLKRYLLAQVRGGGGCCVVGPGLGRSADWTRPPARRLAAPSQPRGPPAGAHRRAWCARRPWSPCWAWRWPRPTPGCSSSAATSDWTAPRWRWWRYRRAPTPAPAPALARGWRQRAPNVPAHSSYPVLPCRHPASQ